MNGQEANTNGSISTDVEESKSQKSNEQPNTNNTSHVPNKVPGCGKSSDTNSTLDLDVNKDMAGNLIGQ